MFPSYGLGIRMNNDALIDSIVPALYNGSDECYNFTLGETVTVEGTITFSTGVTYVGLRVFVDDGSGGWTQLGGVSPIMAVQGDRAYNFSDWYGAHLLDYVCTIPFGKRIVRIAVETAGAPNVYNSPMYFYIGFNIDGSSSDLMFDTTADFNTGTFADCMAENDELYGGYLENFADLSLCEQFTDIGTWVYSGANAYMASGNGSILPSDSFTAANLARLKVFGRAIDAAYGTAFYFLVISDKATIPTAGSMGTSIISVYRGGSGNRCFRCGYKNAAGTSQYWNYLTQAWTTTSNVDASAVLTNMISAGGKAEVECSATQWRVNFFDDEDVSYGSTSWVDKSDLYEDTGILWSYSGTPASYNYGTYIYSIERALLSNVTWTTPAIDIPATLKMRTLAIALLNGVLDKNYIDKVEVLGASDDSVIDYCNTNIYTNTTLSATDFHYNLDPTYETEIKVKIYMKSLDTTMFSIDTITIAIESLAVFRCDGQVFIT